MHLKNAASLNDSYSIFLIQTKLLSFIFLAKCNFLVSSQLQSTVNALQLSSFISLHVFLLRRVVTAAALGGLKIQYFMIFIYL